MKCARSTAGECWASKTRPPTEAAYKEENHELVYPDSIYSGHSSSQLLDGRYGGCRRALDYLLIRRTLKHAADSSTDQGGGKRRWGTSRAYVNIRNCHLRPALYRGAMATFLYRCPTTGHTVQGFAADNAAANDSIYEAITCVLCRRVHLVNPATGRVAGADSK
jgi:hypothetical protein